MAKAITMQAGNQTILVETDDSIQLPFAEAPEATPGRRIPKGAQEVVSIKDIKKDVSDVKDMIVSCCNTLYAAVAGIPQPESFAVEFGIKLAGEAGVPLLTKASGEANFKVTVSWKK